MQIGVVFPQTEIGADPGAIKAYAVAAQELGFRHLLAYDHVVGADPAAYPGFDGPYNVDSLFHEPFVLYGYLAAITSLELVTGVIILPQRQTVLVAKQAAQVDRLTGGKFRLGVGLGWNAVEYEALGKDFHNRGRRLGEQIALLRELWTKPVVTFRGKHESVTAAGLNPLPVQRPIPVWIGARSEPALRRAGRLADGWFPQSAPGPRLDQMIDIVRTAASQVGRDPSMIGMEGRVHLVNGVDLAVSQTQAWQQLGATHLSVNTMDMGVDDHIEALAAYAGAIGLAQGKHQQS